MNKTLRYERLNILFHFPCHHNPAIDFPTMSEAVDSHKKVAEKQSKPHTGTSCNTRVSKHLPVMHVKKTSNEGELCGRTEASGITLMSCMLPIYNWRFILGICKKKLLETTNKYPDAKCETLSDGGEEFFSFTASPRNCDAIFDELWESCNDLQLTKSAHFISFHFSFNHNQVCRKVAIFEERIQSFQANNTGTSTIIDSVITPELNDIFCSVFGTTKEVKNYTKMILSNIQTELVNKPNNDLTENDGHFGKLASKTTARKKLIKWLRTKVVEAPEQRKVENCLKKQPEKKKINKVELQDGYLLDKKEELKLVTKSPREKVSVAARGRKPEKKFVCSGYGDCNRRFPNKRWLERHVRVHNGEKPFKCDVCQSQFLLSHHLKNHMRLHTGEKPFKCLLCGGEYSQYGNLQCHMRMHTGEKPFECSVCVKRFAYGSALKAHMRTHTGEKPFECTVCRKQFGHVSSLNYHIRTHTGERPFKCSICDRRFILKKFLTYHMKKHTMSK